MHRTALTLAKSFEPCYRLALTFSKERFVKASLLVAVGAGILGLLLGIAADGENIGGLLLLFIAGAFLCLCICKQVNDGDALTVAVGGIIICTSLAGGTIIGALCGSVLDDGQPHSEQTHSPSAYRPR